MQRILLMAAFVLANVLTMSGAKKTVVERIEPTDWYVGMKNPQVGHPRCGGGDDGLSWRQDRQPRAP